MRILFLLGLYVYYVVMKSIYIMGYKECESHFLEWSGYIFDIKQLKKYFSSYVLGVSSWYAWKGRSLLMRFKLDILIFLNR